MSDLTRDEIRQARAIALLEGTGMDFGIYRRKLTFVDHGAEDWLVTIATTERDYQSEHGDLLEATALALLTWKEAER